MRNLKWPVTLLVAGIAIRLFAMAMKIMHWPANDIIQITGTSLMAVAIALILSKMIFSQKDNQAPACKS